MNKNLPPAAVGALLGLAAGFAIGRPSSGRDAIPAPIAATTQASVAARGPDAPPPATTRREERVAESAGRDTSTPGTPAVTTAPGHVAGDAAAVDDLPALRAANQQLRTQLQAALAKAENSRSGRIHDLTPDELREMAKNCELRWDTPSTGANPSSLSKDDATALGLSDGDREAVNQAYREFTPQLVARLRPIYQQLTGDPNPGSLTADAMLSEISQQVKPDELKVVFQRLSSERAGGVAGPVDPSALSASEQLYRLLTGAGDAFEASVAKRIGAEQAHALRRLRGGFGSKHASSHGCP